MKFRLTISLIFLGLVLYVIIQKLIHVPISHDEAWTIMQYLDHSVWDIMMYPDSWPNNHILNTILAKYSGLIFGYHDWAFRIPNALAFLVYALAVYRLAGLIFPENHLYHFMALCLFCANPYMLDFFSLCRGYGISIAFLTCSMYLTYLAYKTERIKFIYLGVLCAMLSAYANFPALVFWAGIIICSLLYIVIYSSDKKKKLAYLLASCIAFILLIAQPIIKMSQDNQFKYWSSNGFFNDTILSSTEAWRYGAKLLYPFNYSILAYLVLILFAIMGSFFIYYFLAADSKKGFIKKPFSVLMLILVSTGFVNLSQCFLLDTPYLNGRTALLYYPLFCATCVSFFHFVSQEFKLKSILFKVVSVVLILISIIHLADRYDKRFVREWWYDANTKEVIQYLNDKDNTKKTLATKWIFHPSFSFYAIETPNELIQLMPYEKQILPNSEADYYYIEDSDKEALQEEFIIEKEFGFGRFLMRKKKQL